MWLRVLSVRPYSLLSVDRGQLWRTGEGKGGVGGKKGCVEVQVRLDPEVVID